GFESLIGSRSSHPSNTGKGGSACRGTDESPFEDRNLVPLLSRGLLWRGRWHDVFAFHTHHSTSLVLRRRVHALAPNPLQLSSSTRDRPGAFDALNHTFRLPVFHDSPSEVEVELIAVLHIADISSTG